jgi:hypothetical protein
VKPFVLRGGVDQITPKALCPPGKLEDCFNYEVGRDYGYASIQGFEAFDGHISPSTRDIWDLAVAHTKITPVDAEQTFFFNQATGKTAWFDDTGTRLFALLADGTVYGYRLTTAWDISTAQEVYNETFTGDIACTDAVHGDNGNKLYILGDADNEITQYFLQSQWTGKQTADTPLTLDVSSEETLLYGLDISADGTELYIMGNTGGVRSVHQYTLSTAWDISSATLTNSESVGGPAGAPFGFGFIGNGYLFYISDNGDDVALYSCSTAWDISTFAYVNSFDVSGTASDLRNVSVDASGSRLLLYSISDYNFYKFHVAPLVNENMTWTHTEDTNVVRDSGDLGVVISAERGAVNTTIRFAYWNQDDQRPNGAQIVGDDSGVAIEPIADTVDYVDEFDVSPNMSDPKAIWFKPNGTFMYVCGTNDTNIHTYSLSTVWDITSAVHSTSNALMKSTGMHLTSDGFNLYLLGFTSSNNYFVRHYLLDKAFKFSTVTVVAEYGVMEEAVSAPQGLRFSSDGSKMYVCDSTDIHQYALSTAWDITTASYEGAIAAAGGRPAGLPLDVWFTADGTRMYVAASPGSLWIHTCKDPWNVLTSTYDGQKSAIISASGCNGLFVKDDYTAFYTCEHGTAEKVHEVAISPAMSLTPLEEVATDQSDYFDQLYNASQVLRSAITPVPGTGPVSGIKWYKNQQTAIRDYFTYRFYGGGDTGSVNPLTEPSVGQHVVITNEDNTVDGLEGIVREVVTEEGAFVDQDAQGYITIEPYDIQFDWAARVGDATNPNKLKALTEVYFSSGDTEPSVGDVITGATSAEAFTIHRIELHSGAWLDADAAGVMYGEGTGHTGGFTYGEQANNTTTTDTNVLTIDLELFGTATEIVIYGVDKNWRSHHAGMYRSSRTGWQKVDLGWEIRFDTGTTEPTPVPVGAATSSQNVVDTGLVAVTNQVDLGGWSASSGSEIDAVASSGGAYVNNTSTSTDTHMPPYLRSGDYFLVGTNFDIPSDARIVGIEFEITAKDAATSGGCLVDIQPCKLQSGTPNGPQYDGVKTKRQAPDDLTSSFVAYTFGGENDMWGLDLTPDDVATQFGVKFRSEIYDAALTNVQIDYIRIRIHYVELSSEVYFYDSVGLADYATANLIQTHLETGAWDGSGTGIMQIADLTRKLIPTKNIQIRDTAAGGGNLLANLVGSEIKISLPGSADLKNHSSKYQMIAENAYANDDLESVYLVSGAGRALTYDGEHVRVIYSGLAESLDKPRHIELFQFRLWLGYGWGEAAISVAGDPLSFDGTLNAVATGYGRPITGFTKLAGKTMGVFTDQATYAVTVEGSDFDQQTIAPRNGAVEYTVQDVGTIPIYADPRGITRAFSTDKYGDFEATRVSHVVHPWLLDRLQSLVHDSVRDDKVVATSVARLKSQYRMYFADGYRLTMTLFSDDEQPPEFTFQKLYTGADEDQYIKVLATDSDVDDEGRDRLFFTMDINPDYSHGADLGYVYEDDRGTSFNGDSFTRWIETTPIAGRDISFNTVWSTWHLYGMAHGWAALALTSEVDLAHPADPDNDTEDANYSIALGASSNPVSTKYETYFNKDRLQQRGRHISLRLQNASDRELPHVLQHIVLLEEKQARPER